MQRLPFVPSKPFYSFTTTITDVPGSPVAYRFDVRWNTTDKAWYFDVRETDGTLIIAGLKIVVGAFLGRRKNHPLFRDGVLMVVDSSGAVKDAGLDDMGTRVRVLRLTRIELLGLKASA